MKQQSIFIIGLGWLGLPLAKRLSENGFDVCGTVTSAHKKQLLENQPFQVFEYVVGDEIPLQMLEADWIIINVPPSRIAAKVTELSALVSVLEKQANAPRLIYISSTGIYDGLAGTVDENTSVFELNDRVALLLKLEAIIRNSTYAKTILRFAGLCGPGREAASFFSGKQLTQAQNSVNMLHLDDAIGAIVFCINFVVSSELVLNVCAPLHPSRAAFYSDRCMKVGVNLPILMETSEIRNLDRVVASTLIQAMGYSFKYPDPLQFP